ncbi:MAG: helix-turn-helix domain-containing protein [Terrimicrobiaceae bacterium]|nr:helix-turn-helix domain-containing protein [Terrimicrobiaceae bacterium]
MTGNLIQALAESKVYRDYERAFSEATGLPVSLTPIGSWKMPHAGKKSANDFCETMAAKSRSCSACMGTQEKLTKESDGSPRTERCEMGMFDSAVPVKVGDALIGFLQTGQVFCKKPTAAQFSRVAKKLSSWGVPVDARLEEAYFNTRVMTPAQYQSMVQLLTIFAQHLSMVTNQVLVQQDNAELPMITRAKAFIKGNQAEDLSLGQVAKAVNTSTFYFCKMFKKATGLNFTEYLSRVRIEKAKNLLLNPNLRVSEIAFEVGFQSLTHFNRVFKKIAGQSPTEYRLQLTPA